MQGLSVRQVSDSDAVRLYEWSERSRDAVLKCTCRQVRRMKTVPDLSHAIGGQTMFLHYQVPGLVAEVCGMIVGVTPKEDQVSYEVDDGTSVLRIFETRKSLRQNQLRPAQAETTSTSIVLGGIPECYIMPTQKASPSASRSGNARATTSLAPMIQRFEVGDIVKCSGKIQIDRGGDRNLFVHQIQRCDDINIECSHQLDAIDFEKRIYRQSFDWSRVASSTAPSSDDRPTVRRDDPKKSARQFISELSQNGKTASAPTFVEPEQHEFGKRRLSPDRARKLLSGYASSSQSRSDADAASAKPVCHIANSRAHLRSPQAPESGARQLRTHGKLSDGQLTEAYFQLQLQQHINQHYHSRPFTMSDLRRDATLSSLARRLVSIRLQRRRTSRKHDTARSTPLATSEPESEKTGRLFEWAMRKMMQDGFIALADSAGRSDPDTSDSYHLVTPEFLLRPLQKLLGNKVSASSRNAASLDTDALTARLRVLDDRFRFVNRSLVQETLALYYTRFAPIVID